MTFHNLVFFLEQEEYEDIIVWLFENGCEDSFEEHRNEVEHIYIVGMWKSFIILFPDGIKLRHGVLNCYFGVKTERMY